MMGKTRIFAKQNLIQQLAHLSAPARVKVFVQRKPLYSPKTVTPLK